MSDPQHVLGVLAVLFTHVMGLALITFGGVNTVLPALHHQAVNEQHWMTDRDFANFFALSSVSPGPNFLLLTLIGYKAAGPAGAIVATVALCGPTSLIAFLVVRVWDRFKDAPWRAALQQGIVPVTVGFVAAASVLLIRASDNTLVAYGLTALTAILGLTTRLNPLWIFAASAIVGGAGFV
jgi:chromate transporter